MLVDRRVERRQLRRLVASPRAHGRLPCRPTPRQRLRDIRNAHPKQFGHLTNPLAVIRRSKHPLPQILRIRLASLDASSPPVATTGQQGITHHHRFGRPYDSARPENALEGASGLFGSGSTAKESVPAVDLKTLHAKIGELTLENDFLSGALGKAGLLSAKR